MIKMEGVNRDYDLPEIDDNDIALGEPSSGVKKQNKEVGIQEELRKEIVLLKEEHRSNVKELSQQVEELTIKLKLKDNTFTSYNSQLTSKDKEILNFKSQIEKLNISIKDLALNFTVTSKSI